MARLSITRFFALLAAVGGLVVLTFADRAPDRVWSVATAFRAFGSRAEQALGIDWVDRSDVPFAKDTLGHAVLWFMFTVVAVLVVDQRVRYRTLGVGLFVLAAASEFGQPLLSTYRAASVHDLAGNTAGILMGLLVARILPLACTGELRIAASPRR